MFLRELFFSHIAGRKVWDRDGKCIGRVRDIAARIDCPFPLAVGVRIANESGCLPIECITGGLSAPCFRIEKKEARTLTAAECWLSQFLLDKQLVDLEGRRAVRVNDLVFASYGRGDSEEECFLAAVDVGVRGLLRRLGAEWLAIWRRQSFVRWADIFVPEEDALGRIYLREEHWQDLTTEEFWRICERLDARRRQCFLRTLDPQRLQDVFAELGEKERGKVLAGAEPETVLSLLDGWDTVLQEETVRAHPLVYRSMRRSRGGML